MTTIPEGAVTAEGRTLNEAIKAASAELGVPAMSVSYKIDKAHFLSDTGRSQGQDTVKIAASGFAALAVDASKLPKGVDASRRERHLSPDAFRAVFGVGATAFSAWPKWRQALAKRKVGLY